jgi:transposase InsO family protein
VLVDLGDDAVGFVLAIERDCPACPFGRRSSMVGTSAARQITEAFPWDEAPRYLIRDRDTSYGAAVTRRLQAMGIRDRPITPRSPWQNGHVERLIGSIRRECLDHVVVLGERHLRHLLANYATYYNGVRTHLALNKDTPLHRPAQTVGRIASVTWLGGLHRHYVRMP